MIGTIAASPSSGAKPSSRSRRRTAPCCSRSFVDQLRLAAQHAHRLERRAGDRRRQRVREELRPRALREDVADLLARRHEAAGRAAERLAQRGGDHVDLAEQAEVLGDAAAGLAHHAGAVRVVDDTTAVVLARQLDDLGQLRQVPLHGEDAVGDDELALPRLAATRARRAGRPCPSACRPPCAPAAPAGSASMILAWLSSSERITVFSSVGSGSRPRSRSSRRRR